MKLNVMDRMLALGLIPEKGTFVTLRVIQDARNVLALSAKEIKEYDVRDGDKPGTVVWKSEGNKDKEIAISSAACEMIKNELKKLDDKSELTINHMRLYEKFVG